MFKYLIIFWNEEENVWAIYSWHTTKKRAEALACCIELMDSIVTIEPKDRPDA